MVAADEGFEAVVPDDPREPYDIRQVILRSVDRADFLEIQRDWAANLVIGFGRLSGRTVGVVANQPMVRAGVLDIDASDKITRFVRMCDCFNIPIVTFVDSPGYLPGIDQEHRGTIRHGAKLLFAFIEATVPRISVIVRKAYGGAYLVMNSKHIHCDVNYAWPTAEIAVMGPKGAAEVIYRKELLSAQNSDELLKVKIDHYRRTFATPFLAAQRGYIDDVIFPRDTRRRLIRTLQVLEGKEAIMPKRKHGNIPL